MARMPDHFDDFTGLGALVAASCCNCSKQSKVCRATERPCDIIVAGQPQRGWRSPMSKTPRRAPAYHPLPFRVTNQRQMSKVLRAHDKAEEIRERSGDGKCTWFDKALRPILPGHIADELATRQGKETSNGREGRTLDRGGPSPRRLPR